MKHSLIRKSGFCVVLIAMSLSGCSSALRDSFRRSPSSETGSPTISRNLRVAVRQFRDLIASDDLNSGTCASRLDSIYDELYKTSPSYFDLQTLSSESLVVVKELWEARVELRKKFLKIVAESRVSPECVNAVRRAQVASRFLEEYVGEWALSPKAPDSHHLRPSWSGSFPETLQSPDFDSLDLRSGDLLLSRGDAFTSAAIARIGDIEGQFSHLAMVYVDEKTGKKYTIEAHIEVGVVVAPIEKYLNDGKVRSTLFRYHGDPAVAHAAAKYMFERASEATAAGANIPYDFHFNVQDDSEVFCAEVAALGYRVATGGKVELPAFQSKMSTNNRQFLDAIGMTGKETFAPMDLEVDPHFDLVGEWRDLSRTEQSHRKDEVLTAMFTWMQDYHYVLLNAEWNEVVSSLMWQVRRWPVFGSLLKEKFPTNMSKNALEATVTISLVAEKLFNDLSKKDQEAKKQTGLWLTPYQLYQALEEMRVKDLDHWQRTKKSRFHKRFHPVEGE